MVYKHSVLQAAYKAVAQRYQAEDPGAIRDFRRLERAICAMTLHQSLSPETLLGQIDRLNGVCLYYVGEEAFDLAAGPEACISSWADAVQRERRGV